MKMFQEITVGFPLNSLRVTLPLDEIALFEEAWDGNGQYTVIADDGAKLKLNLNKTTYIEIHSQLLPEVISDKVLNG